jgi:hypothetical protein
MIFFGNSVAYVEIIYVPHLSDICIVGIFSPIKHADDYVEASLSLCLMLRLYSALVRFLYC